MLVGSFRKLETPDAYVLEGNFDKKDFKFGAFELHWQTVLHYVS